MGVTKSGLFSDEVNELADMAKAIAHPARIAILKHLVLANAWSAGTWSMNLALPNPLFPNILKN